MARGVWDAIPDEFRAGVEGLVVVEDEEPHPELPEVWTLGECATGELDGVAPGEAPADWRSVVVLYYGSFVRVAEREERWDWEEEIWETITHEIRHHRESGAGEDALEEVDYAEDQGFLRSQGEPFDPLFYRAGEPLPDGTRVVGRERFVERAVDPREWDATGAFTVEVDGRRWRVPRPGRLGDVHLLALDNVRDDEENDVTLVLVRRRGAWEALRGMLFPSAPEVVESVASAEEEVGE